MTTIPAISELGPADLIALKTQIDARLEDIKQRHREEGAALGLKYVDGTNTPKRKRREKSDQNAD